MKKQMSVAEALKELGRQERRIAASGNDRGGALAKSAHEYYKTVINCRKKLEEDAGECTVSRKKLVELQAEVSKKEGEIRKIHDEAVKLKARIIAHRKVVRNGDILIKKEHLAQIRFIEKVKVLRSLATD